MDSTAILPSTTGLVTRGRGHIRKVHSLSHDEAHGDRLLALWEVLTRAEVRVPRFLAYLCRPALTTYWEDLGPAHPVDWPEAGAQLRRVHAIPLASVEHLRLPSLAQWETHHAYFEDLARLVPQASSFLTRLEQAAEKSFALIPPGPIGLVHDELRPTSFLTDGQGKTWILNWTRAGLAGPAYDLAFLVRAEAAGDLTRTQRTAFEEGYGEELPPLSLAHAYGTLHRARWAATLVGRSAMGDGRATGLLAGEAPLWLGRSLPA